MLHLSTRIRAAAFFVCCASVLAAHTLEKELAAAYDTGKKNLVAGLQMTTEVLRQARERHDVAAEAAALAVLGNQQRYGGQPASALANGREAVKLARTAGDEAVLARALYDLGRTANEQSLVEEAAECYVESAEISERRQDLKAAGNAHTGLGAIYHRTNNDAKALEHHRRALALAEEERNPRSIGAYAVNLGETLTRMGAYAEARALLGRAQVLLKENGSRFQYYATLDSLAVLEIAEGNFQAASTLLDECLAYIRPHGNEDDFLSAALCHRARALRGLGRPDEALAAAQESVQAAERTADKLLLDEALSELATVQAARRDFAAAFAAERRARKVHDDFNSEQTQRRVSGLQARLNFELQRNTIERLDREKQLQATQLQLRDSELHVARQDRFTIAGAALFFGAFLSVGLVLQRRRLRAERLAREQSEAARVAADEANRTKTRLLNFASHDLKAPLASLGLAARELERSADRAAEVRELAALMHAETLEMARLVHDFLDHSTIDAGRLELKFAPVDLADVAAHVGAELLPLARAKAQTLTIHPPPQPLALVLGESARLGQVLGNLLSNAIKFTPTGGRIDIASGQDATGVWCEVRDSGPGIAPADLARLFQPFAKLSARPTGGESSTGLGLSLARELISLHGGVLQVESQPGQGAVFRVVLAPAETATTPDDAPPSAPGPAGR